MSTLDLLPDNPGYLALMRKKGRSLAREKELAELLDAESLRDSKAPKRLTMDYKYVEVYMSVLAKDTTLVYLALLKRANYHNQHCFPSYKTIMADTGLSKTKVHLSLKSLELFRIIQAVREGKGRGCFNLYGMNSPEKWLKLDEIEKSLFSLFGKKKRYQYGDKGCQHLRYKVFTQEL